MDVETPPLRRNLAGWWIAGLAMMLATPVALADELPAGCSTPGLVIHGPEATLRDYCREEDGRLWLQLPGGARFELVTRTNDPVIANPGSGTFHAFDEAMVRAALHEVRFPVGGVSVEIFLLPYPRRDGLQSAAGSGLILLSPGVWPLTAQQQHAEVVHELGHVVQYGLMPDHDETQWSRYRELRGLTDLERFTHDGVHADRPHEIFAEDFRALFGGGLANYSGTIENATLCMPQSVSGLESFMRSLAGVTPVTASLMAYPNPSRGVFRLQHGGDAQLIDLYDLFGRRVATLEPRGPAGQVEWTWDGMDRDGRRVSPGVLLARVRGSSQPALRLVVAR